MGWIFFFFFLKLNLIKLVEVGNNLFIYEGGYTMIIEIISYISVLALLISLLNLVLSLIVYYGVNDYINEFKKVRWYVSFIIVVFLIIRKNIIIN